MTGHFESGKWIEDYPATNRELLCTLEKVVHEWGRNRGIYIKLIKKGTSYERDRTTLYGIFQMIKFNDGM